MGATSTAQASGWARRRSARWKGVCWYVEKYRQDSADYLMEVMGEWGKHYDRAVLIDMGGADGQTYEQRARDAAARRGWTCERRQGNRRLLTMLVHGEWPPDEFLVVPPGHRIRQSGSGG